MSWLRALMLLALIVWIGGIIFFSFVLAPTVFTVLPTTKLAGDVVSASLSKLHWMAYFSGIIFLVASIVIQVIGLKRQDATAITQKKLVFATHMLVLVMLALTWISQAFITPRIRDLREKLALVQRPGYDPYIPGSIPTLIANYRHDFDRMHAWSTRAEGSVFFCGLVVVVLTARRFGNYST
jgi:uncharacterized membrane protein